MSKYILDDTPKTPFAIKHIEMVSIILSVLVGVTVGTMFLIERFLAAVCNYLDI